MAAMLSVACVLGVAVVAAASGAQDAAQPPSLKAGAPGTFPVVGAVNQRLGLNTAVLALLPQKTVDVQYRAGATVEQHTFTGPLLLDVIGLACPSFDPAVKNRKLRHSITAMGSDGDQRWWLGARSRTGSARRRAGGRAPARGPVRARA